MKGLITILAIIGIGWWLFSSNNSSSNYSYPDTDYSSYETDRAMDRYDALSDYWDEIVEYIDGTETVEACSDSSGNCYDLDADISSGEIETLYFSNGGYISIYGADIESDGEASGSDDEDNYWTFQIDEDLIDDALENWAYDNDVTLE